MILVVAGTADAREFIGRFAGKGIEVLASAATPYGASLALEAGAVRARAGPMDEDGFHRLLLEEGITAVVDASHPYAGRVSAAVGAACHGLGIKYVRYGRPESKLPQHPLLCRVAGYREAASAAAEYGGDCVMLATGVRQLEHFTSEPLLAGRRLVVRVLPLAASLEACSRLGIPPRDIVAMQGPFSYGLNRQIYLDYGVTAVVTKDGGREGGTMAKVGAALDLGLPVIVVTRPVDPNAVTSVEAVLEQLGVNTKIT